MDLVTVMSTSLLASVRAPARQADFHAVLETHFPRDRCNTRVRGEHVVERG
jgi:hypothetical protein